MPLAPRARSRFDDHHATDRLARWSGGVVLIGCVLPSAAPPLVGADHMAGWAPIGLYALGALLGGIALWRGTKERWSAWNGIGLGVGLVLLGLLGRAGVLEWGPFFVPRPPRDPGPPLTEPEARAFGEELAQRLSGDPTGGALLERLDMDALTRRAGLSVRTGTLERYRGQLAPLGRELGRAIDQVVGSGGSYRVASVELQGVGARLVLRLLGPGRAPSYQVLRLVRGPDGALAIGDVCGALGAPELSWFLGVAVGREARASQPLGAMVQASAAGKPQDALVVWRRLAAEQRRGGAALMVAWRAARLIGQQAEEDEVLDAIEASDRPELGLLLLERSHARAEHQRCEALLARVQALVKDPYLNAARAAELLDGGVVDRAQELALAARAAVPELPETWWVVARAGLVSGDYAQALEAMQRLAGEFGVAVAELEQALELRIFRITPQGAAWEAWKAAR